MVQVPGFPLWVVSGLPGSGHCTGTPGCFLKASGTKPNVLWRKSPNSFGLIDRDRPFRARARAGCHRHDHPSRQPQDPTPHPRRHVSFSSDAGEGVAVPTTRSVLVGPEISELLLLFPYSSAPGNWF